MPKAGANPVVGRATVSVGREQNAEVAMKPDRARHGRRPAKEFFIMICTYLISILLVGSSNGRIRRELRVSAQAANSTCTSPS
jgi:hypothetical protein